MNSLPMSAVKKHATISWLLSRLLRAKGSRTIWADPRTQSWAHVVGSHEDVPDVYKSFFDALPTNEEAPFPYTVLTPTFKGIYRKPEPERLVCAAGSSIHILERIEGDFHRTSYRLDAICSVETGLILLHSWITIHGFSDRGVFVSTTLIFNSVTDHVMAPFVERVRSATVCHNDADLRMERTQFSYLAEANFKFMSYAERSISPGERVVQTIYQPEIRLELLRLLGFSLARPVSPAHLCILTDSELILISDDDSQRWLHGSPHGAIWTYMPLKKIASVSLSSQESDVLALSVRLHGDLLIEPLFEASKEAELKRLLRQLNM